MRDLQSLVARARLVTIVGCGGIGKSRLARELALRVDEAFEGRVWFAELANVDRPELLLPEIARALGLRQAQTRSLDAQVAEALAETSLLVLDNCEHLSARVAETAVGLLRTCPRLTIVLTTREPLAVEGEHLFDVAPLEVPEETSPLSLETWDNYSSVSLFVERALANDPAFRVTPDNVGLLGDIARRLGGIPLAIELAAGQLRTVTVARLSHDMGNHLRMTASRRDIAARHRSMNDTLLWTYSRLGPDAQALWKAFSLFRGGATLDAARTVAIPHAVDETAFWDALGRLTRASLVRLDDAAGDGRYRMLEPVRLFGVSRAREDGDYGVFRDAHIRWCRSVADAASWRHSANQAHGIEETVVEHANLAAAFDRCLEDPGDFRVGAEIICDCFLYWGVHGWYQDLCHYSEAFLANLAHDDPSRPLLLFATGLAHCFTFELAEASRWFGTLREITDDDSFECGLALLGLGMCELFADRAEPALLRLGEAELVFSTRGPQVFLGMTRVRSAQALTVLGKLDAARDRLRRNLDELSPSDRWSHGMTHSQLGAIAWRTGDLAGATSHFRAALTAQKAIGHRYWEAVSLSGLGRTLILSGEIGPGVQLLGAAEALFAELGTRPQSDLIEDREVAAAVATAAIGADRYEALHRAGMRLTHDEVDRLAGSESVGGHPAEAASLLTRRELEIAALVAQGATNRQISFELVISLETVKSHVRNILRKLEVESRVELAIWYSDGSAPRPTEPPGQ